ncbi:2-C-methyl-D-erythritol 2,4-cyclodiphosphate synthase [Deinococcus xianganensis]|uniref:2-C-methyl-D-erythritol 2,4-cyclodiphosphate synthase n=1 Tax=Deinococcus xianganensis TaxID=1507289 RepID=A0A6I4YMN7_9DEIO|nr:2-C-methyl-D-erythritol 2,4-cyclodiphosphate synthase [Deinococcus xianganensis]MXV18845.1 2-C-methyl-D-erythritol 2,4-cyclodiphosphate synthase [Deinococcus xianganensis]
MSSWPFRVGFGEDAHRLEAGRRLVLGGVDVPHAELGAVAHSDGDAVLHVVADALLSGLALGDIGQYFPDTAEEWRGMDSRVIVERALALVQERGWVPVNVAVVVTLDRPKLGPLRAEIARSVAALLSLPEGDVGISFKTSEGLAPLHVQTRATVLLARLLARVDAAPGVGGE